MLHRQACCQAMPHNCIVEPHIDSLLTMVAPSSRPNALQLRCLMQGSSLLMHAVRDKRWLLQRSSLHDQAKLAWFAGYRELAEGHQ